MAPICAEFAITVSDFRKASYYALFLRYRRPFLFLFLAAAGAALYALGAALGLGAANPLVFLLSGAYCLWGLVMAIGEEKNIRAYVRSAGSLLGLSCRATLTEGAFQYEIPKRQVRVTAAYSDLACAFELQALFLLYTSPKDVYLLPKRALTEKECGQVRALLRDALKDRFATRFR